MSEVAYFRVLEAAGVPDVIAIGRLSDTQWSPSGGEIAMGDARVQAADCYVVTALPARNATGTPESRMRVVLLDQSTEHATDLGWLDALGQ
ncbi:MAG: hypothetical protein FDZ70_08845 [Actinobacteria bacterium]|nr:MAG: hypothetical protein FDZ70_08845 [Actinomycetota bacterium]